MYSVKSTEFCDSSMPAIPAAANREETAPHGAQHTHANEPVAANTKSLQSVIANTVLTLKSRVIDSAPASPRDTEMTTVLNHPANANPHGNASSMYVTKLMPTLVAWQQGDFNMLLPALDQALPQADAVINRPVRRAMDIRDANDAAGLRAQAARDAMAALGDQTLSSLSNQYLRMIRMSDLMASAAKTLVPVGAQAHLGQASTSCCTLFNHHANLKLLCAAFEQEMAARNISIFRHGAAHIPESEIFNDIHQCTDIQLGRRHYTYDLYVVSSPVASELKEALAVRLRNAASPSKNKSIDPHKPQNWTAFALQGKNGDKVHVMIADSLHLGASHNIYTYQPLGSDTTVALAMPSIHSNPDQDTEKLQFVFDELANSNPKLMRWLSYFGSKEALYLFQDTLANNPALNPVRLPDGTSGYIHKPYNTALTYHFVPRHDGGITIHFKADIQNATELFAIKASNKEPDWSTLYALDPTKSHQKIAFSIDLDNEGMPSLWKQMKHSFDCHIKQVYRY